MHGCLRLCAMCVSLLLPSSHQCDGLPRSSRRIPLPRVHMCHLLICASVAVCSALHRLLSELRLVFAPT